MQLTERQLNQHYAVEHALLHEYFPCADRRVINDYVSALRAYDDFPSFETLKRLAAATQLIASSIPTIQLES